MAVRALAGLRVLEMAEFVAGPYCGKLLADMGAEVVKVEQAGSGDIARKRGPFGRPVSQAESSSLFCYLNTNKKGASLNLESDQGKHILKELIGKADIFIADSSSRQLEDMGLYPERKKDINPGLIVTSITPFGLTGPYRDYKANYLNTYHSTVLGYCTPIDSPNLQREPLKIGGFIGEYACGLNAAIATLAALYYRNNSGLGQLIEVSKQETLTALHPIWAVSYANEGIAPTRLAGSGPFDCMMPCKNGYLVVVFNEEHQWQGFVKLMGNPEWARDERLKQIEYRSLHWDKLEPRILEWLRDHTKEEIYHDAQALGCPMVPVLTVPEVLNSEQFLTRQFFAESEHPIAGKLKYPSLPYLFSNLHCVTDMPAPLLGQHNKEIYEGWLGYSPGKLSLLEKEGIV